MQKSVSKSDHRGPRNLQNYFSTWHAKPNRNPILFILKYLGLGWSVFQPDFCIETVGLKRSFGVQLKVQTEFLKSEDFAPEPQKWPQKPKVAGKLELIGEKGFSFSYMRPLN